MKEEEMIFTDALFFALEKKDLATKSKQAYHNRLEHVRIAAQKLGIENLPISQVTRPHIVQILTQVREDQKLSNHGYNKYRDTIRAMFSTLQIWLVVENNPATKIESKRTTESNKYSTINEEEKLAIKELLYKQHYNFFVYIQVLYHTGIRPKEILALRIGDIDLKKQIITITPDLARENSKTKSLRLVPISDQLLPFLLELELNKYPGEYYLFGSSTAAVKGIKGNDYFIPSSNQMNRDTVTKLWKKIIIDGLGINKHLYALKRTGEDDKILAGIDLDTLRGVYENRGRALTEQYVKKVKELYRGKERPDA